MESVLGFLSRIFELISKVNTWPAAVFGIALVIVVGIIVAIVMTTALTWLFTKF